MTPPESYSLSRYPPQFSWISGLCLAYVQHWVILVITFTIYLECGQHVTIFVGYILNVVVLCSVFSTLFWMYPDLSLYTLESHNKVYCKSNQSLACGYIYFFLEYIF